MKIKSKSTQSKQKTQTKSAERQKISFLKELVENADLYKPVLSNIMTTHE